MRVASMDWSCPMYLTCYPCPITAELHPQLLAASPSLPELLEELLRSSEESLQQAALWILVQLSAAGEECSLRYVFAIVSPLIATDIVSYM